MAIKSPVHRKQCTIHRPRRVNFCHKASHNAVTVRNTALFIVIDDCFYLSVFFLGLCWELRGWCHVRIDNCRVECEFLNFVRVGCSTSAPCVSRSNEIGAVRYAIFEVFA